METKEFRIKYNLSQTQLANLLNVDQSTVAYWESGKKNMSYENKLKYNNLISTFEVNSKATNKALFNREKEAVYKTINELLEIALQHNNLYEKRAVVKMSLLMIDESIKRGGNNE